MPGSYSCLNDEAVLARAIRLYRSGVSPRALAREFGVRYANVRYALLKAGEWNPADPGERAREAARTRRERAVRAAERDPGLDPTPADICALNANHADQDGVLGVARCVECGSTDRVTVHIAPDGVVSSGRCPPCHRAAHADALRGGPWRDRGRAGGEATRRKWAGR